MREVLARPVVRRLLSWELGRRRSGLSLLAVLKMFGVLSVFGVASLLGLRGVLRVCSRHRQTAGQHGPQRRERQRRKQQHCGPVKAERTAERTHTQ